MRLEELDAALGAMRATDGDDPELAEATQLRVRRSLESRARGRHQLVGVLTTVAILFAGTVSWALATGQVAGLWTPTVVPLTPAPVEAEPPARTAPARRPPRQSIVTPPPPVVLPTDGEDRARELPELVVPLPEPIARLPEPEPVAPRPATPRAQVPRPASDAPVEALYRSAHNLHFHGGDPAATLAAWDAYLAAEPTGTFAVEARYNRALTLIRLRRYAAARDALLPFARGDVDPPGYRRSEAEQLVERLARAR